MKDLDKDLEEIKKLSQEADSNKGFEEDFEQDISKIDFIDHKQNPQEPYRLYHAIEGILRSHLPAGAK
ncbi:hypothetical protein [Flagellimonas algicola]|uniref:Uncharacterized protein n=1 Tax=Flagellimonas algicola TaxID=2583815 RepID=A0ABY2WGK5_9FLAO|nr:hypothetical protein [Allomuricauda algicola]TMU50692.1 hypothetical protein FGG15_17990 [Allomuricauda algicola]